MTSFIWLGPLIGVLTGFFLAGGGIVGVVGAALGAWLGFQFDTIIQLSSSVYQFTTRGKGGDTEIQQAFSARHSFAWGKWRSAMVRCAMP
ncbi:MAG: hypothetical protein HPY82_10335, partial [Gammaproteobacteria bacterium]|nr:hypothetical protein [Gammaproteobacteria bacterium]